MMAPNQRLALIIMGSVLFLCLGRFLLFAQLIKKPTNIETNIQAELEDLISQGNEAQNNNANTTPLPTDSNNPAKSTLPSPFPLTILLPPRTKKEDIDQLFARLDPEKNFLYSLVQPSSFETYLRAIDAFTVGDRQVDLILLPWQEIDRIHHRATQIDRSATPAPTGLFHPQVGHLLTASKSLFLPHAIDPRVTITQAPTKALSLGTFLQTHQSPVRFSITESPDSHLLIQLAAFWLDQLYSAENVSLTNKIFLSNKSEPCNLSPSCLDAGTSALRLPLSALTEKEITSMLVSRFPSLDETVPTTVRGRVVRGNDAPAFVKYRLGRIQKYLTVMSADQLPYESPLLPAYFPRLKRILLQDERSWMNAGLYRLALLQKSSTKLLQQFSLLPIRDMLDGSYRPALYLEKRQEINTHQ